jgi:hypothetical protein
MAEYIKFRLTAAKVGVSMTLMALIAGIAAKAQSGPKHVNATQSALFLKLGGISGPTKTALAKLAFDWQKLHTDFVNVDNNLNRNFLKIKSANNTFLKIDDASKKYLKIDDANAQFLKIDDANSQFLKIDDANSEFLKTGGTAANSNQLGGLTPDAFVQGHAKVVSGMAMVTGGTSQSLLQTPDGIVTVSVNINVDRTVSLVFHNNGSVNLEAVGDPTAVELPAGQDSAPLVIGNLGSSSSSPAAESTVQILPAGSFNDVITLTVSAFQPATGVPAEVVGQMLIGSL